MSDLKDLVDILSRNGPADSANAIGQGFQQGQNIARGQINDALEMRKAAFAQKLQEAGLFNSQEVGQLASDAGVNLMPNRNVNSTVVDKLAELAQKRQTSKDAAAKKVSDMAPLDPAEVEATAKAIELSGSPNAKALADAYRQSAPKLSSEKGGNLGARYVGIATQSGTAASQPMRTAQGDALKNIDIPNNASATAAQIVADFNPAFLGPTRGRTAKFQEMAGNNIPGVNPVGEQESRWRAAVANMRNTNVKEFAGSAVSGSEWSRVKQALPDETMAAPQFIARYNRAADVFNSILDSKEKTLGVNLGIQRWPKIGETGAGGNSSVPQVGQTFNGERVLKVTRIK
jgi:hypothetical protein